MQQITVANQRLERYWNCLIVQILVWNWKSTNSTEQKTAGKLNKFTFLFRKLLSFRTTKLCIFLVLKQSNLWSARFFLSSYLCWSPGELAASQTISLSLSRPLQVLSMQIFLLLGRLTQFLRSFSQFLLLTSCLLFWDDYKVFLEQQDLIVSLKLSTSFIFKALPVRYLINIQNETCNFSLQNRLQFGNSALQSTQNDIYAETIHVNATKSNFNGTSQQTRDE